MIKIKHSGHRRRNVSYRDALLPPVPKHKLTLDLWEIIASFVDHNQCDVVHHMLWPDWFMKWKEWPEPESPSVQCVFCYMECGPKRFGTFLGAEINSDYKLEFGNACSIRCATWGDVVEATRTQMYQRKYLEQHGPEKLPLRTFKASHIGQDMWYGY